MSYLRDNLIDLKRVFWPGTYQGQLYDADYATKADAHAHNALSLDELDWVAGHRDHAEVVLDIGCNTGRPLNHLSHQWQAEGLGVDINENALARARENFSNLTFKSLVGSQLPAEDSSVDHVMVHHVLGHVPDPPTLLKDIARVLRPGGTLSIVTPNTRYKLWQFPMNIAAGFQPDITVLRYYSTASLRRELTAAGLNVLECQTRGLFPDLCPPGFQEGARLRVMAWAQRPD